MRVHAYVKKGAQANFGQPWDSIRGHQPTHASIPRQPNSIRVDRTTGTEREVERESQSLNRQNVYQAGAGKNLRLVRAKEGRDSNICYGLVHKAWLQSVPKGGVFPAVGSAAAQENRAQKKHKRR